MRSRIGGLRLLLLASATALALASSAAATAVQIQPPNQASIQPVTGSFTATGQSASWVPAAGQGFNIHITGTFVGTVQLERRLNGVWAPLTFSAGGNTTQMEQFAAPASDIWIEPSYGVSYRLNCTAYTSGTIAYQVSQ